MKTCSLCIKLMLSLEFYLCCRSSRYLPEFSSSTLASCVATSIKHMSFADHNSMMKWFSKWYASRILISRKALWLRQYSLSLQSKQDTASNCYLVLCTFNRCSHERYLETSIDTRTTCHQHFVTQFKARGPPFFCTFFMGAWIYNLFSYCLKPKQKLFYKN